MMMKFLSILKDSFREAMDGKIIYAMLVMALLFTILVASISFKPVSVEDHVRVVPERLNAVLNLFPQPGKPPPPHLDIENFKQTNDSPEPWNGDYSFDFTVSDKDAAQELFGEAFTKAHLREEFSQGEYFYLKNVDAEDLPADPAKPKESKIRITTHGTRIKSGNGWPHKVRVLFSVPFASGPISVEAEIWYIEKWGIHKIGSWVALLMAVIITSFFVPNMLRKGSIDLLISKPIPRSLLLIYKFFGGLCFILIITSFTVLATWLVLGLRSGIWGTGILLVIPTLMLQFAILYSISTVVAVFSRSAIVSILVTIIAAALFWAVGFCYLNLAEGQEKVSQSRPDATKFEKWESKQKDRSDHFYDGAKALGINKGLAVTLDVLFTICPRTGDIDNLTSKAISESVLSEAELEHRGLKDQTYGSWVNSILVSLVFIGVMLGLACWRFSRRDE